MEQNIILSSAQKTFFPNLDGLRTMAFLMVFLQHGVSPAFNLIDIEGTTLSRILSLFFSGSIGVSIFFVLSGFLITYLILKEIYAKGSLNVKFFYIRRILRIWPLYYAVLIFAFFLYPSLKSIVGMDTNLAHRVPYYFLFLSNFDAINIFKYHAGFESMSGSITWSVAIEEQFYLIWPLLFWLISKRFYPLIFIGTILCSLVFRVFYLDDAGVLYYHSLSICSDLAIGGLCAYYSINSRKFISFFQNLNKSTIIFIYAIGAIWIMYHNLIYHYKAIILFIRVINSAFFAFILLEQNYSKHSFYKFSNFTYFSYWGKYTYGLYLLHPIALTIIDLLFRIISFSYKTNFSYYILYGALALGLSMIMSYISFRFFESKFLLLKNKFTIIKNE